MRRFAIGWLVAILVGALSSIAAPVAFGHNVLVDSTPEDGSSIDTGPSSVELVFDQPVQNQFAQVAIIDSDENHYVQGDPEVVGATVTQAVDDLPEGTFTVSYRVLSADGHPVEGTISFTVGDSAGQPTPADSVTEQNANDNSNAGLLVGAATVALAGIAAIVIVAGRRRQPKRGALS